MRTAEEIDGKKVYVCISAHHKRARKHTKFQRIVKRDINNGTQHDDKYLRNK